MCNSQFSTLNSQFSICLPLSKSVRARELVLDALAGKEVEIETENDDIFVLSRALNQCHDAQLVVRCDLHHSGTALRFMTAYCSATEGEFVLVGSERLCERPIKPLVDALRGMGADIEYVDKEGFAPLRIRGKVLKGGEVRLDASLSSQFASALMLISDKVDGGIEIKYEGDVASQSYISLTQNVIEKYRSGVRYSGERDWSSATVWYAAMAVMKEGRIMLEGLSLESSQPDRRIVEVFEKMGVVSMEEENGVEIECGGCVVDKLVLDCKCMPDAVMYIAVAACLLGIEFEISGVETLRVKESDRIEALITEMRKCGYALKYDEISKICWLGEECKKEEKPKIETYNDHRMAMAFAPCALVLGDIRINEPHVVSKSYPRFWDDLKSVGFSIEEI